MKDRNILFLAGFLLLLIAILSSVFPEHKSETKYIDDKINGVVWVVDSNDTLGTLQ